MYNISVGRVAPWGECSTFSPIPTNITGAEVLSMKVCKVPDCTTSALAKGYCQKHYTRAKRHGEPMIVLSIMKDKENHNMSKTIEYSTWHGVIKRCCNKKHINY